MTDLIDEADLACLYWEGSERRDFYQPASQPVQLYSVSQTRTQTYTYI